MEVFKTIALCFCVALDKNDLTMSSGTTKAKVLHPCIRNQVVVGNELSAMQKLQQS